MTISRVHTWIAGEVLTAADLNAEINNILNNTTALVTPLTANLIWNPDATYDIGASGASRPRDLFLSRNAVIGGTLTLSGALTYGGVALTAAVSGTGSMALTASPTFTGTVNAAALTLSGLLTTTSPAISTSITTPSTTFTAFAGATTLLTLGGTGATSVLAIPGTLDASGTTASLTLAGGAYIAKKLIGADAAFSTGIGVFAISGAPTANHLLTVTTTTDDYYAGRFVNNGTTSHSYGLIIEAGTNASDFAMRVLNKGGGSSFLNISGNGAVSIPGTGPHAIGGSTNALYQWLQTGAHAPADGGAAFLLLSTITAAVNGAAYGMQLAPTIVEAGSGVHGLLAAFQIAPTFTNGAATATIVAGLDLSGFVAPTGTGSAATVRISAAPTGATNNYPLWIDADAPRFDEPVSAGAGVGTLTNVPNAGGGNPAVYFKFYQGTTAYAVPAFAL